MEIKNTTISAGVGGPRRGPMSGQPVVKPKNLKGTLRRLWELTAGHRKGLGSIMVLSALACLSAILSPYLIGRIITSLDKGNPVGWMLLMLLGLYVGDWLVRFLQQFFMASVAQRIIHFIRTALFHKMKQLPLSFFDQHQHGELMSRLTNDVDNISTTISNSLSLLLTHIFTVVGVFCIMMALSPILACISLVGVGLVLLLTKVITRHTRKLFREQQIYLGRLNGQVEECVSGMNLVKAFCREEEMVKAFQECSENLCTVGTKAQTWSGYLMPITNVINNLSFVAVSIVSGMMAVGGAIAIGTISSFLLYTRQFSRPFVEMANIYNNFQTAVAGAERIFEIMDQQPEPEDPFDALPLENPKGDIVLDHVSFGYHEDHMILKDVSVHIPVGTKVAVVGPTGAGKTTIIQLLTRFYDVSGGSILLDGNDLRRYRMAELRQAFGVVLQDTALFAQSVRDNIAYGRENVTLEEIQQAAKVAGADGFIRRLPKGYDTVLWQGGAELSQGERQLLTIARAVLADAPILILDEATSSVDTVTEQKIRRAMLKITQGRTSFIIAHRLSTIRDSDRILLIDGGKIVEEGTHEELMQYNGKYAAMYRTQMGQGNLQSDSEGQEKA